MTSKDSFNSDGVPVAASAYTDRTSLHEQIRAGHLPDIDNLLEGGPFFAGDLQKDRQVWCDSHLLGVELEKMQKTASAFEGSPQLRPLIQNLRDTRAPSAHWAVEAAMRLLGHDSDADRCLVYLSCMDDTVARERLVSSSIRGRGWEHDDYDRMHITAVALGMMYSRRGSMEAYCKDGIKIIETDANALARFNAARDADVANAGQVDIAAIEAAKVTALLQKIVGDDETAPAPGLSRIVVPVLAEGGSGHRKDIERSWKGIAGSALPVVQRGNVAAHMRALSARWPHAAELIEIILSDLSARDEVRFKPTLVVGTPGSGKSSMLRAICDQLALPCELYSMAGIADGSMGGTSAQWSTARESVPLQLIKRSKHASVAVVWDEVEKAGEGRHNGNALDTLLPMLELDQAKRFRDLALEVEVDLSMVSHFGTANSIEGIPAPLRDRMRILVMPEPTWQHLGVLTKQIVERIATERGVDRRWFAPLAEDEMDLVKAAWPGGSIRQLTRIVTTLVDGRDRLIGRC